MTTRTIKSRVFSAFVTAIGAFLLGATLFSNSLGPLDAAFVPRMAFGFVFGLLGLVVGPFLTMRWAKGLVIVGGAFMVGSIVSMVFGQRADKALVEHQDLVPRIFREHEAPANNTNTHHSRVPSGWSTHQLEPYGVSVAIPPDWKLDEPQPGAVWQAIYSQDDNLVLLSVKVSSDPSFQLMSNEDYFANVKKSDYEAMVKLVYENVEINSFRPKFPFSYTEGLHVVYSGEVKGVRIGVLSVQTIVNGRLYTFSFESMAIGLPGMVNTIYAILDTVQFAP